MGQALHKKLTHSPWEGTSLLKFMYGQLYNNKLAKRHGHSPTDECPLCHMLDSCTHIARVCPGHEAVRISRHNAACQLIHAAIRKTAKEGGVLHSAMDLVLVMADTGTQPMTTRESMESLTSSTEDIKSTLKPETPQHDWLAPLPTTENIKHRRHTVASQDPKYN